MLLYKVKIPSTRTIGLGSVAENILILEVEVNRPEAVEMTIDFTGSKNLVI